MRSWDEAIIFTKEEWKEIKSRMLWSLTMIEGWHGYAGICAGTWKIKSGFLSGNFFFLIQSVSLRGAISLAIATSTIVGDCTAERTIVKEGVLLRVTFFCRWISPLLWDSTFSWIEKKSKGMNMFLQCNVVKRTKNGLLQGVWGSETLQQQNVP